VHIVLPKKFLPKDTAILVPQTDDGRVLFLVPWHGTTLLGTTDTEVKRPRLEPRPLKKEIQFLLKTARRYLVEAPKEEDILSIFAGHRPLVKASKKATSALSRDHTIEVSTSSLITIAGGKWTTYRKMAEDVVNKAMEIAGIAQRPSITHSLPLHGYEKKVDYHDHRSVYGTERRLIEKIEQDEPHLKERLHPLLPYTISEVVWAVRYEMARTVEDILSRRTRALLLDAKAAVDVCPIVADILAKELGKSVSWQKEQVEEFNKLARNYLPPQKQ
jgi:glycerol-3-phosphate dehydrogenase